MGRMQRQKGKRGERCAARHISEALGLEARRGAQHKGGPDSPDIVVSGVDLHWEVKFVEREAVRAWMEQAQRDAAGKLPVVLHRRKGKTWLVTVQLEHLNEICRRLAKAAAQALPSVGPAELPG